MVVESIKCYPCPGHPTTSTDLSRTPSPGSRGEGRRSKSQQSTRHTLIGTNLRYVLSLIVYDVHSRRSVRTGRSLLDPKVEWGLYYVNRWTRYRSHTYKPRGCSKDTTLGLGAHCHNPPSQKPSTTPVPPLENIYPNHGNLPLGSLDGEGRSVPPVL